LSKAPPRRPAGGSARRPRPGSGRVVSRPAGGGAGWIQLFGAVSFELFGQLDNVIEAREAYFDYQMGLAADHIGL